ncbi:MAG TPA: peptidoglycan DD-metalloendopeptidase family protein [Anaerolineae bacterium]|nr:peptidoglycan DD-metalloendopeptidase family protein [Anaerolineae bacterium]
MSETHLTPRVARRIDDAQPASESKAASEPDVHSSSRRWSPLRRDPHTPVDSVSVQNPEKVQSSAPKPLGQHIPIERWFARFAVLVGGKLAWLTTCEQGRSLLFRYTSHFVILAVLIGAIGLISTARTTAAASSEASVKRLVNSAALTPPNSSSDGGEVYNSYGQGGPIVVDQIVVAPQANPFTDIPSRERRGVITYTVQAGDTLFGIAGQFGLRPESILWANYDTLQDNPHLLKPGQDLAIPPVNGIVYTVVAGDTVESIAEAYKVTPDAIYVDGYQWNLLKPGEQPFAGQSLIIPGGSRDFKPWSVTYAENEPQTNDNSSSGTVVAHGNIGTCAPIPPGTGLVGTGNFIWPAPKHWLSGNPYAPWHPGIDIAAKLGDPIYAADNGIVIYAGWNNWGYGNLVVIDHGNGWQTYYAHNSEIYVTCGQNVYQGSVISAAGSTGHSTGPHLHFETRFNGTIPNPFNVLPPP